MDRATPFIDGSAAAVASTGIVAIAAVGLRQLYLQVYYDKPRRVRL